ncbi:GIY-YIG nuclease superfamily protein [bacterium BMS3Abin15]|nr:GIY-YIG nuclease superfamily protein [bacterium BMS3Abin15]
MYYVYVLKSLKDKQIYVGHCNNLKGRIRDHNLGLVKSTKPRRPLKLIYYEACNLLEDAAKREKALKSGFGRAYLKRRLSDLKK